jgi:hypothetical protein
MKLLPQIYNKTVNVKRKEALEKHTDMHEDGHRENLKSHNTDIHVQILI